MMPPGRATLQLLLAAVALAACAARESAPVEPAVEPAPLPAPRHGHRIEAVDGGWLCFGGLPSMGGPPVSTQTFWLGPHDSTWRRRADMAVERAFFSSFSFRGAAYAVGPGLARYDAQHDRWEELLPEASLPRSHFGAARVGSRLHVLGGFGPARGELLVVDLASFEIAALPGPPGSEVGDHFAILCELGGELHVIGGVDADVNHKREHWVLSNAGWRAREAPPPGIWAKFAIQAVARGRLYLFGDFGAFCFDPLSGAWTARAAPPGLLALPQALAFDGSLWVVGGLAVGGASRRVLWRYDVARNCWENLEESRNEG